MPAPDPTLALPPAPPIEHRMLLGVQRTFSAPAAVAAARGLSVAGEHAGAWLLLSAAGAAVDPSRRARWVRAGSAVLLAHAVSVALKRVVRRRRPQLDGVSVRVGVPSRHSFPSSHATSTTAAAVALSPLVGPWLWPVAVAMCVSRTVLGVHYPSDVAAGALLGAGVARLVGRGDG